MKKPLLYLLVVFLISTTIPPAKAQSPAFMPGSNVVNIGVGMWGTYYRGNYYGHYNRSYYIPNISVSLDHALNVNAGIGTLGVGGIIAVRGTRYNEVIYPGTYPATYYWERRWTDFFIGGRLTYHLGLSGNDKFDFYPGLSLGFVVSRYTEVRPLIDQQLTPPNNWYQTGEVRSSSGRFYPAFGLFLGLRYNFTDKIGIFTEFGWEFSAFKLGLAIKF